MQQYRKAFLNVGWLEGIRLFDVYMSIKIDCSCQSEGYGWLKFFPLYDNNCMLSVTGKI